MLELNRWRRRIAEARALLETERKLLVAGALGEIAKLAPRRQSAAAALDAMPAAAAEAERSTLAALRRAAERNLRLLKAYRDGAADAAARIRALEAKAADIGAYRPDGSRLAPSGRGPTRERRA